MKTREAIKALGLETEADLAAKLGVSKQAVNQWTAAGEIPPRRRYEVRDLIEERRDERQQAN